MKRILSFFMTLCVSLNLFAQATSLTVDNQTPGWLSSKINYGDQQTLENVKVTGYMNEVDLSFLGSLSKYQKLNGVINLENVQITAENNAENNKLTKSFFGGHIQHLILPKSLVSVTECLTGATLDTLTIGGESLPSINSHMFYKNTYQNDGILFSKNVKHLILREGVTTIERCAFYGGSGDVFESIVFPNSLVTIEDLAFEGRISLSKAELTDNIEEIGEYAFANTGLYSDNDTIRLPKKIKTFYLSSFAKEPKRYYTTGGVSNIECFGNQHIYVPKNVVTIDAGYVRIFGSYEKCYLHINNEEPPSIIHMNSNMYGSLVVYVPKGSVNIYKSDPVWQNAIILAEPNPAKIIDICDESISIVKGSTTKLNAVVLPEDADDKSYIWSTSNPNVVSITQDGLVTAISSGETKVFATLNVDKSIVDSCIVKVYQPVTALSLNMSAKDVKVGDTFNIEATINPTDADNKNVIWSSENDEIAIVVDSKVTALKPGVVWIKATSEDNAEAKDSCMITITQPVTGIQLDKISNQLSGIGDSFELNASVLPGDASNKNVKWSSSNESVCIVSNGVVVAIGEGTCVIIATTEEGGYIATCTVTVTIPTNISSIELGNNKSYQVYDVNGSKQTNIKKGINIIRFIDGANIKVLIK